jgi:hypothetical protein
MEYEDDYERIYYIRLLDDIHNYFPDLLYNHSRFGTVRDVLGYVQEQTQSRFNLFQRGYRRYRQRPIPAPSTPPPPMPLPLPQPQTRAQRTQRFNPSTGLTGHVDLVTETFDITPLLSSFAPSAAADGTSGNYFDTLMRMLITGRNQEPVIVTPSAQQINDATCLKMASTEDEDEQCAVCQESYTEGQALRKIHHCGHIFHKNCIDIWFQRNVYCPVCRFDIRDHIVSQEAAAQE